MENALNPAWAFKNAMWLCAMGWHNLTNQRTDFVAQYLKCCYGSFWSARAKSVVKVFLYNCLPVWSATTAFPTADIHLQKQDRIYCVFICSLEVQVNYYWLFEIYYNQWPLLLFLMIFSASLSGSDDFVLFDSLDGNGAYSQMFYAIFQFYA